MRRALTASALALTLCSAGGAWAQGDWSDFFDAAERASGTQLLVWNPAAGEYQVITLETLLRDLVRFPDAHRRYAAVRGKMAGETQAPAFVPSDFTVASSVVGWGTGLPVPAYAGSEETAWLAVAVPVAAGELAWLNLQTVNDGSNFISLFVRQGTVEIAGATCAVWATRAAHATEFFGFTNFYFDGDAAEPAP